jgi:hypothetical protein
MRLSTQPTFEQQEIQQLAVNYVASAEGLGLNEVDFFKTLERVGKTPASRDAFDAAIREIHPGAKSALSIAEREFASNPLKRALFKAKLARSQQLYYGHKAPKQPPSDWHYRLEGMLNIPLGLFQAFKAHFFVCAGTLAGIAMFASFVPYLAAQLSNVITLMSAMITVKSELAARRYPKGSTERQEKLQESGEGMAGMAINFVPLAAVLEHLQEGRQAIKGVVRGEKTLAQIGKQVHAAEDAATGGLLSVLKTSAASIPAYVRENLMTLGDASKTLGAAITHPRTILTQELPKTLQAGLSYDSSLPQTLKALKAADSPKAFMGIAQKALTDQAVLAMTLIDEILFPMVKILQGTSKGEAAPQKH